MLQRSRHLNYTSTHPDLHRSLAPPPQSLKLQVFEARIAFGKARSARAGSDRHSIDMNDQVLCDCGKMPPTFNCERCKKVQHLMCALSWGSDAEEKLDFCNQCWTRHLNRKAEKARREYQKAQEEKVKLHEQAKDVIRREGGFWRHYCQLPKGQDAPQAVVDITKMVWRDDKYEPEHQAPGEWIDELLQCLDATFLNAAHEDRLEQAFPLSTDALFSITPVLAAWRREAVHQIHHGYLRGQRERLGLLGELLGLEDVGTYWKGLVSTTD